MDGFPTMLMLFLGPKLPTVQGVLARHHQESETLEISDVVELPLEAESFKHPHGWRMSPIGGV